MYIVVRKDLKPTQIAVQAGHAILEASVLVPPNSEHPHFVLCGIDNEQKLQKMSEYFKLNNIEFKEFREADLDNQLTAIATKPISGEQRKVFKKLQLLKASDFQKEN